MLRVNFKGEKYQFPVMSPTKQSSYIYGTIGLDNNWRELDYKNGGHTLELGVTAYFQVPRELFPKLYKSEFFYSNQIIDEIEENYVSEELPLISFDLDINYTKIFDFTSYESVLIGNIKTKFPAFKELENLKLDENIVKESLLRLGNCFNYEPTLKRIHFGRVETNKMNLICFAEFETFKKEKGTIEVDVWLPINLYFKAGTYTDDFPNKSQQEKAQEIKDCFASIYKIEDYNLIDRTFNKESKEVIIQFEYKN
jgi:hypothetical protein